MVNIIEQMIRVRSIGAIDADGRHSHGYYMVDFKSSPYTLQINETIDGEVIESA